MTLSYEDFKLHAEHFKKLSDKFGDEWCICKISNNHSDNYIFLKKTQIKSCSFEANGKLLSFDQLVKFVHPQFQDSFEENKWNILTQQEHPYLRSPFFMLHPCNTANLLHSISSFSFNVCKGFVCIALRIMKVLELYSGVGGMHFALKGSTIAKHSEVVLAVELNPVCNEIYRHNFPKTYLLNKNITSLSVDEINNLAPDVVLMSPPCQPFTRLGKQKDLEDTRNHSFLRFIDVLPKLDSISFILIENVMGFEKSETRQHLLSTLKENNFTYEEYLLNPRQFGICNSRLRYYLLAKKSLEVIVDAPKEIILTPPDEFENIINLMQPVMLPQNVSDVLEIQPCSKEWDSYLLSAEQLEKYYSIMDIVTCTSKNTCCFTRNYSRCIERAGSLLSAVSDFQKCYKKNNHDSETSNKPNNDSLKTLKLRFFTPREIARLMMFPESFSFPEHINLKQRYKTIGNSINIFVVSLLISHLTKDSIQQKNDNFS